MNDLGAVDYKMEIETDKFVKNLELDLVKENVKYEEDYKYASVTVSYLFKAKTKEEKDRIAEGNLPKQLSILMHVIRQLKHSVTNMVWDYKKLTFRFDVKEEEYNGNRP